MKQLNNINNDSRHRTNGGLFLNILGSICNLTYLNSQVASFALPIVPVTRPMSSSSLLVEDSGSLSKRRMPPIVSEAAGKRQRVGDQADTVDQASDMRKLFSPHMSLERQNDLSIQAAANQPHAKAAFDANTCDLQGLSSV